MCFWIDEYNSLFWTTAIGISWLNMLLFVDTIIPQSNYSSLSDMSKMYQDLKWTLESIILFVLDKQTTDRQIDVYIFVFVFTHVFSKMQRKIF